MDCYDLFLLFALKVFLNPQFFLFFSLHFRKIGIDLIEVSDIVHMHIFY